MELYFSVNFVSTTDAICNEYLFYYGELDTFTIDINPTDYSNLVQLNEKIRSGEIRKPLELLKTKYPDILNEELLESMQIQIFIESLRLGKSSKALNYVKSLDKKVVQSKNFQRALLALIIDSEDETVKDFWDLDRRLILARNVRSSILSSLGVNRPRLELFLKFIKRALHLRECQIQSDIFQEVPLEPHIAEFVDALNSPEEPLAILCGIDNKTPAHDSFVSNFPKSVYDSLNQLDILHADKLIESVNLYLQFRGYIRSDDGTIL